MDCALFLVANCQRSCEDPELEGWSQGVCGPCDRENDRLNKFNVDHNVSFHVGEAAAEMRQEEVRDRALHPENYITAQEFGDRVRRYAADMKNNAFAREEYAKEGLVPLRHNTVRESDKD